MQRQSQKLNVYDDQIRDAILDKGDIPLRTSVVLGADMKPVEVVFYKKPIVQVILRTSRTIFAGKSDARMYVAAHQNSPLNGTPLPLLPVWAGGKPEDRHLLGVMDSRFSSIKCEPAP